MKKLDVKKIEVAREDIMTRTCDIYALLNALVQIKYINDNRKKIGVEISEELITETIRDALMNFGY